MSRPARGRLDPVPRGSSLPAVATVQSIASQVRVARATWTQTSSPGSFSHHWRPPTAPCRASRASTAVRGRRARLSPPGRRRSSQTAIAARPKTVAIAAWRSHDPFQRAAALEGEAVDELAGVGAGVGAGGGRDRAGERSSAGRAGSAPAPPRRRAGRWSAAAPTARSASTRRGRRRRRAAASRG